MDVLNEFRQWMVAHWSMLEAQGMRITLSGQTQQQTVNTNQLYLYAKNNRYEACVIVWEFGNCDVTIADMEADKSLPLDACVETLFFEGINSTEALNSMMESILSVFRTTAQLIADRS